MRVIMNRVLIVDNSIDHEIYEPVEHWTPLLLFPSDSFHASYGEFPSSLDPYSHIILTGSEASVLEKADWISAEEELIRTAVGMGKVILGSCFGHQMIARSLFGMNAVRRLEKPEFGWPDITVVQSDPFLGQKKEVIHSFVLHYDEVSNLPNHEATVLARSSECPIQAFKLRQKPVWGVQPHPEIGIVEGLRLLEKTGGNRSSGRRGFLEMNQAPVRDSGWIIPLMRAFQETSPSGETAAA